MKKLLTILLIVVCACVCCLAGCEEHNAISQPDENRDFSHINVIRRSDTVFDIECDTIEGAIYYVTTGSEPVESDKVDAIISDRTTSFSANITLPDEYSQSLYIWREYKGVTVSERVYIPDTSLYVYLNDDGTADIFYNCVNVTTISSYYAATGKSLYKSSKATFDTSANIVSAELSLASKSDLDSSFTFKQPYYYVSFTSRNGKTTYITEAAEETTKLVQFAYASLTSVDNKPILHVDGRAYANEIEYNYRLAVRQENGQILYAANSGSSTELSFDLDLSKLSAEGVWYDVFIEIEETGAVYDLSAALSNGATVEVGKSTYEFKEYYGSLKINFRTERLDVSNTSAELKLIDSKPMLIVKTALLDGATKDNVDAHLEVRYQPASGNKISFPAVYDCSTESSLMEFRFDLSQMSVAGNWHDIVIVIDGKDTDIMVTSGIDLSQTINADGRTYCFKTWSGILKVTY